MALKYMLEKSSGELTSARELCDRFHTPFDTTAKVLQTMNQQGLLSSVKGMSGGYTLAKPLTQISFFDLAFMIDPSVTEKFCQSSKGLCDLHSTCNVSDPLEHLNDKIHEYLKTLMLQDLLLGDSTSGLGQFISENKNHRSISSE